MPTLSKEDRRQLINATIAEYLNTGDDSGLPPSDGTFANAALITYQSLVFDPVTFTRPDHAAALVRDELARLGFKGTIEFGYSANNSERTQEGEAFTGPYMRVRTATGELHVLEIGVEWRLIQWVDGIA